MRACCARNLQENEEAKPLLLQDFAPRCVEPIPPKEEPLDELQAVQGPFGTDVASPMPLLPPDVFGGASLEATDTAAKERPHPCAFCGKRFTLLATLKVRRCREAKISKRGVRCSLLLFIHRLMCASTQANARTSAPSAAWPSRSAPTSTRTAGYTRRRGLIRAPCAAKPSPRLGISRCICACTSEPT